MSIPELFCSVEQLAPSWQGALIAAGQRQHLRLTRMHSRKLMAIMILFHQSYSRTFKAYYTQYIQCHLRSEFPTLVSYHSTLS